MSIYLIIKDRLSRLENLPPKLRDYILSNWRDLTTMSSEYAIDILERLLRGEKIRYKDVRGTQRIVVSKMRKDQVLILEKRGKESYLKINEEYLE